MGRAVGFTAVVCGADGCSVGGVDPLEALRHAVRRCDHGVLVKSDCPLALLPRPSGTLACHPHESGAGPFVLVQQCDAARRAVGEAALAGPLHEAADVRDLCRWLTDGLPAGDGLPNHLRPTLVAGKDHR